MAIFVYCMVKISFFSRSYKNRGESVNDQLKVKLMQFLHQKMSTTKNKTATPKQSYRGN